HRVPGESFSTKRPDTFAQTVTSINFKTLAVRRRTIHALKTGSEWDFEGCLLSRVDFRLVGQVDSSAVRTAWPATRPAHSFLQLRAYPLDVLLSGFQFLDRNNPADPLIACEWRYVLPFC